MTDQERRELDAFLAERLFGWQFEQPRHGNCCTCQRCGRDHDTCNNQPCTITEDGWPAVLEAMHKRGYHYTITDDDNIASDDVCCEFWRDDVPQREFGAWGRGLGEAVALAAKAALEVEVS